MADRPGVGLLRDEALAWAESVLGEPVVEVTELSGGLTSTMLARMQTSGSPLSLGLDAEGARHRCRGTSHVPPAGRAHRASRGRDPDRDGRDARPHPRRPPDGAVLRVPVVGVEGEVGGAELDPAPRSVDAAHAATTLAAYATTTATRPQRHWLVMDAVGFLPAPGGAPLFGSADELERLDAWLRQVVSDDRPF